MPERKAGFKTILLAEDEGVVRTLVILGTICYGIFMAINWVYFRFEGK